MFKVLSEEYFEDWYKKHPELDIDFLGAWWVDAKKIDVNKVEVNGYTTLGKPNYQWIVNGEEYPFQYEYRGKVFSVPVYGYGGKVFPVPIPENKEEGLVAVPIPTVEKLFKFFSNFDNTHVHLAMNVNS